MAHPIYKVDGKALEEAGDFEHEYEKTVADSTTPPRAPVAGR